MIVATKERTPEQAVAELRRLREKHGGRARGQGGLTLKIIAEQVGLKSTVTVSWWFSDGENHHLPTNTALISLNAFLDKVKRNPKWFANLIEPKRRK